MLAFVQVTHRTDKTDYRADLGRVHAQLPYLGSEIKVFSLDAYCHVD
jgi:hypothetical protein